MTTKLLPYIGFGSLLIAALLLVGCVLHDPYTRARMTTPILMGMSQGEVQAAIGPPTSIRSYRLGGATTEIWLYEHSYQIHPLIAKSSEHTDMRFISFIDGRVVGHGH